MLKRYLQRAPDSVFILFATLSAFGAYFCMYAFRKPFTVATYEGIGFWGDELAYKSALVISQVVGYALSKFIGIKVISELKSHYRVVLFLLLIGLAEVALLLFAIVPAPWNVILMLFNGLPLGMIWGIVFSYLEGRRFTEILGAGLSTSFIIASGAVKSIGQWLMLHFGVSEFWMPAVTGAIFILPLLLFAYLLEQIPPPTQEDIDLRTERKPMTGQERVRLFRNYAPGLVLLIAFYTLLTAYRDFRDNFAAEIWSALGFDGKPYIFTASETPIAVLVLLMVGATMWVKDNRRALRVYLWLILGGAVLVGVSTLLFSNGILNGALWMVLVGLGLYMAYILYNCILFDRMIAAFRYKSNAGFLIYVADAFGYLGSVAILFVKDFGRPNLSWIEFFTQASYMLAAGGVLLLVSAIWYFSRRVEPTGRHY